MRESMMENLNLLTFAIYKIFNLEPSLAGGKKVKLMRRLQLICEQQEIKQS
jgi:hypothetical protein